MGTTIIIPMHQPTVLGPRIGGRHIRTDPSKKNRCFFLPHPNQLWCFSPGFQLPPTSYPHKPKRHVAQTTRRCWAPGTCWLVQLRCPTPHDLPVRCPTALRCVGCGFWSSPKLFRNLDSHCKASNELPAFGLETKVQALSWSMNLISWLNSAQSSLKGCSSLRHGHICSLLRHGHCSAILHTQKIETTRAAPVACGAASPSLRRI